MPDFNRNDNGLIDRTEFEEKQVLGLATYRWTVDPRIKPLDRGQMHRFSVQLSAYNTGRANGENRHPRQVVFDFSQGSAHSRPPTLHDVLYCVQSDIRCAIDYPDILEFAAEFGCEMTTQEERANLRNAFNGCKKIHADFLDAFGPQFVADFLDVDYSDY